MNYVGVKEILLTTKKQAFQAQCCSKSASQPLETPQKQKKQKPISGERRGIRHSHNRPRLNQTKSSLS